MRLGVLAAGLVLASTTVLGGRPGSRLSIEDIVIRLPGVTAEAALGDVAVLSDVRIDGDGNEYSATNKGNVADIWRTKPDGTTEIVAEIVAERSTPHGAFDRAEFTVLSVDPQQGQMDVLLKTDCWPMRTCGYGPSAVTVRLSGLGAHRGGAVPAR